MELKITGDLENQPNDEDIERVQNNIGFNLPTTYVDFVKKYGTGLLCGLFVIKVPYVENEYLDLLKGDDEFRKTLIDWKNELGFKFKFESEQMYCFGVSENGDFLLWDKTKPDSQGEFPILVLGHEMEKEPLVLAAHTLDEFVNNFCLGGKVDELFPMGQDQKWNLPSTFEIYTNK